MMEMIQAIACTCLVVSGLFILLVGVIGVFRFEYALNRMHAAAMNDTLGILLMVLAVIVKQGADFVSLKLLLLILLLWITSPVSSHLIGRLEYTTNEHILQDMEGTR